MNLFQWILEWLFMIRDRYEFGEWETRTIYTANGHRFLVDAEDYARVNQYRWSVHVREGSFQHLQVFRTGWRNHKRCSILLTRMLMNPKQSHCVAFRNDDRLDCRKANLLICVRSQLQANARAQNLSGYRGVTKTMNRWYAAITVHGKRQYLGCFLNAREAAVAYNEAAKKHYGEFARLNPV